MKHVLHRRNVRALLALAVLLLVVVALFASLSPVRAATNYYVATTGNDANPGTSASPFRTIQKCADVMVAGDTCLVRSGTYRETVTPARSGTSGSPITYRPDTGATVTVSGANPVTGWTQYSGNTYRATVTLRVNGYNNTGFFANQVFVNGQMINQARWPNTGLDQLHPTEEVTTTAGSCNNDSSQPSTIYDANLPAGTWVGATIHVRRTANWIARTGTVTAYTAGVSVTFSGASGDCGWMPLSAGSHYYLTNGPLSSLDSANEWYYDGTAHQLYLQTTGGAPVNVEAKQRINAFNLSGRSYIQIQGFQLFASTITTNASSSNDVLDGISAQYLSHFVTLPNDPLSTYSYCGYYCTHLSDSGIILQGSNHTLKNSTLVYSAGNGVGVLANNSTVTNNLIHETNYSGTYNAPIRISATGAVVTRNTVYNTGRDGIQLTGISVTTSNPDGTFPPPTIAYNATISYNDISNFGLINDDLGGIYICCEASFRGSPGSNGTIDHNWIHDHQATTGSGIYIDNGAAGFRIHHNVAWNSQGDGIKLNSINTNPNCQAPEDYTNCTYRTSNNQVYNNTTAGRQDRGFTIGAGQCTGVEFINNIFLNDDPDVDPILSYCGTVVASHNITTNPGFVNGYHLASGSSAINAGQVISGITTGYVGSAPDIGAYEYGGTDWTPGATVGGGSQVIADGRYKVVNVQSALLLDDTGYGGSGTGQQQWTANGATNQQWDITAVGSYYKLINVYNGLALDSNGTTQGGQLIITAYTGADSQLWSIQDAGGGSYKILNKLSGLGVNVEGGSMLAGAHVIQWPYTGTANERWQLTLQTQLVPNGRYKVVNVQSALLLDDTGYGGSGTGQQQWTANGATNQQWDITAVGNYYKLINVYNGLALDSNGSTQGAQIIITAYTGADSQLWSIQDAGGGSYKILNKLSGLGVNVEGGSVAAGAHVIQWPYTGTGNEKWTLVAV
jgi:hypothetical protein